MPNHRFFAARGFRAVAVDLRGSGGSALREPRHADVLADLAALLGADHGAIADRETSA